MSRSPYFHGGVPGLKPGDVLLPPAVTRAQVTTASFVTAAEAATFPWATRTDLVYCTRLEGIAVGCALFYPDGALYRVQPQPPVEADPDSPGDQVSCPSAVVLGVEAPRLRLRDFPEVVEQVLRMRAAGDDAPQLRRALWAMRQVGLLERAL